MSSTNGSTPSSVLSSKDANASMNSNGTPTEQNGKPEIKSMEYHRQMFQSKMEQKPSNYISPSDNIMSPCTAKLNAFRNKQVGKVKPKSLFAQASAKKLEASSDGNLFGSAPQTSPTKTADAN